MGNRSHNWRPFREQKSFFEQALLILKVLLALLVLTVGNGCFPAAYVYYQPIADRGRLSSHDPGILVHQDQIEFQFDGTKVSLHGGSSSFYLIVSVPEGKSAFFVSDQVKCYEAGRSEGTELPFHLTYYDSLTKKSVRLNPTGIMRGKHRAGSDSSGAQSGIYENSITLNGVQRDEYSVKLPAIQIDDRVYEIPIVTFIKKEGVGVFPLNG